MYEKSKNIKNLDPSQLTEREKLNTKIKIHQERFQNFYLELMKPYINEYCILQKKMKTENNELFDEDSDDSDRQFY